MPRMRTATGALEIIKQQDPGTAVTLHYIRQLISSGKVPFVPVGRKKLINVDELLAYLERPANKSQVEISGFGSSEKGNTKSSR